MRLPRAIRAFAGLAILMCGVDVHAERLPLLAFTTADGLARDQILRVVRDSRGLLWFCTKEGLSRFDGRTFTTYTTADGLPHRSVRDLLETKNGEYWIATGGGVVRLNPDRRVGAPLFTVVHDDVAARRDVWRLFQDSSGGVWVGTLGGLLELIAHEIEHVIEQIEGLRSPAAETTRAIHAGRRVALEVEQTHHHW